jgi:protein-tyrosine phosphatase
MNDINKLSLRIPLEGTINTRDLGGFETSDKRHIKYKRIIRTDNLSRLTPKDISYFHNVLDARFDVDFRSHSEICGKNDKEIPNCQYIYCPITDDLNSGKRQHPHEEFIVDSPNISGLINYIFTISHDGDVTSSMEQSYRDFVGLPYGIEHYRIFMNVLLKNKEGSVLFHCADGKDRAGIGCALFLSALGVDKETILKDYLKTNVYTKEKADRRAKYLREDCHMTNEKVINSVYMLAGVRENWIKAAFDEINTKFQGIDNYLHNQLELSDSDLKDLKSNYLE